MKTAIILSYKKSNRFKDLYPKCLINIRDETLLDQQVRFLRKNKCEKIYVIGGYKIDRLTHQHGVEIIYYPQYEEECEVTAIKFALSKIEDISSLFILDGNIILPNIKIGDTSFIFTAEGKKRSIGCYSVDGYATRMSFDSCDKWARLIYLDKSDIVSLYKVLDNQWFIFEVINDIIDDNRRINIIKTDCKLVDNKKDIQAITKVK